MSYFAIIDTYMASPINDKRTYEEHHTRRYILKLIDGLPGPLMYHRRREHFTASRRSQHHLKIAGVFAYRAFSPDTVARTQPNIVCHKLIDQAGRSLGKLRGCSVAGRQTPWVFFGLAGIKMLIHGCMLP